MLKYIDSKVVFNEVPDEITLAINMSGCPIGCPDCHSKYLWKDEGKELTIKELEKLIDDNWGIYDYGFRYFHDYRTTYLLDEDPHYVPNGNSQYKSVHINILEDTPFIFCIISGT